MLSRILRLNKAGQALEWIEIESAACLYAKKRILWTYGEQSIRLHGGMARLTGTQSILDIISVIATDGKINTSDTRTPRLCNESLFRRDSLHCMYCGNHFNRGLLTRDHIIPRALGGRDRWENCITACKSCNNLKGSRTPEQANMPLLAVPFRPNKSEYLALQNRNILADQMAFLTRSFSKNMKRY
ncbi:MAG: HNH endonuclease [Kangiellaceae bacterium]|nr:HNH endonuclease [Kangiellaceae bacterium]